MRRQWEVVPREVARDQTGKGESQGKGKSFHHRAFVSFNAVIDTISDKKYPVKEVLTSTPNVDCPLPRLDGVDLLAIRYPRRNFRHDSGTGLVSTSLTMRPSNSGWKVVLVPYTRIASTELSTRST